MLLNITVLTEIKSLNELLFGLSHWSCFVNSLIGHFLSYSKLLCFLGVFSIFRDFRLEDDTVNKVTWYFLFFQKYIYLLKCFYNLGGREI